MRIPYWTMIDGVARPILRATLYGPLRRPTIDFLVDSGADRSTIPTEWMTHVGLPLGDEPIEQIDFQGERSAGKLSLFDIGFGDYRHRGEVVADPKAAFAVLGHRDFFRDFWVAFDSQAGFFIVSPNRRRS